MLDAFMEQIHLRAMDKAAKYLVAEAELLSAIIDVDRHKLYEKFGETYLTPYCVKYLNLSEDVAGMFVRVARKSQQVPEIEAAVHEGLHMSKARVIASVIDSGNADQWIEMAQTMSKEKLEREVAAANPSAPKPEKAKPVGQDRIRVEFEVTYEEAETLKRARELLSQKRNKNAQIGETFVTALADWVEREDPVRKAERAEKRRVQKRAAEQQLVRPRHSALASDYQRPPKTHPPRDGSSLHAQVVHQVNLRDRRRCCHRMPDGSLCGSGKWTDVHHILHRADGGGDELENLITLCRAHHRQVHANSA